MSDERERHEGEDPVADFFAQERASIRPEPADDVRWARIVREARRGRRSRWLATVGGVAAAGVVAASLAFGPQVADTLRGTPQQGPVAPASQSAGRSAAPSPHLRRSSPVVTPPVHPTNGRSQSSTPSGSGSSTHSTGPGAGTFLAGSLSNSGQDRLYLLGSSPCGSDRCPVLQTSSDNGRTWHVVHAFSAQDSDLSQVRFANPDVGWVYGSSSIKVTRDGGRTWRDYPFEGDRVFDLESNGTDVIVASSSECSSRSCAGLLEVARSPIGATLPSGATGMRGPLQGAQISASKKHIVIVPNWPDGAQNDSGPWTLDGGDLVHLGKMPGNDQSRSCDSTDTGALVVGANDPDLMASACPTGDPDTFRVDTSRDGGITWLRHGATLTLPGDGRVSLTQASKSHLLAVRGATMLVSTDGGVSWHEPATPPPAPKQGWAWVGAPGGRAFYALAQDEGGYWVSNDWGEHWTEVTPVS